MNFKLKKKSGFSTLEILISIFIFSVILYSALSVSFNAQSSVVKSKFFQQSLFLSQMSAGYAKALAQENWDALESFENINDSFVENQSVTLLYDYSKVVENLTSNIFAKELKPANLISIISDRKQVVGKDTCLRDLKDLEKFSIVSDFGLGQNTVTDIEAVRGLLFISSNSTKLSDPDLYIFDVRNPKQLELISELDTGYGVNSLVVAGRYVFLANDSSVSQLQVIDVNEVSNPEFVENYRLSGNSSTTVSKSIFYDDEKIYLGSKKHDIGLEFHVLDVSNPLFPTELGQFEIGTQVNDIFVRNNFAFIATPNPFALRILDLSFENNIEEIFSFYSGGSQKHGGQKISLFDNFLLLGRSIGLDYDSYHELFLFDVSSPNETRLVDSKNIQGSIRSVLIKDGKLLLASLKDGEEMQVWNFSETGEISGKQVLLSPDSRPISLDCDGETIYLATEDPESTLVIFKKDG